MKKFVALFLAIIMCLSFVACSNDCNVDNDTVPQKELKDMVIGTWIREYTFNNKYYVTTIEIFPGGTGTFQTKETDDDWNNPQGEELPDNTTWEIKDDIINITIKDFMFGDSVTGYVYSSEEKETLQTVDGERVFYRKSE